MTNFPWDKYFRGATAAMLLGAVCVPGLLIDQAKADTVTDQIIQNVVQNILQNVRDQVQRRNLVPLVPQRALRFSGEDANLASNSDAPFSAMAYAKMPTKAPPMLAPPSSQYLYGFNLSASGDASEATSAGVTTITRSVAATGAVDITKIGVFNDSDAVSVIFTGMGIWSSATGLDATTSVGAGTIAYINGGFSTDFTVNGNWTRSSLAILGIPTTSNTSGVSYSPNVQYKFELGNSWYIEPTVGFTYTQTFDGNFDTQSGHSTEVHGGARIGFESVWNGVRVQPSVSAAAFSVVDQSIGGGVILVGGVPVPVAAGATTIGQVGARASGKLNILWTDKFSSFVEAHGSSIANITAYGASGGLRWTF